MWTFIAMKSKFGMKNLANVSIVRAYYPSNWRVRSSLLDFVALMQKHNDGSIYINIMIINIIWTQLFLVVFDPFQPLSSTSFLRYLSHSENMKHLRTLYYSKGTHCPYSTYGSLSSTVLSYSLIEPSTLFNLPNSSKSYLQPLQDNSLVVIGIGKILISLEGYIALKVIVNIFNIRF